MFISFAYEKTYNIDKIPSFSFNIDIPTGFSSLFNDVAKAQIYLFGSWVGWDNIYYKKEPDYLTSIDKFFLSLIILLIIQVLI